MQDLRTTSVARFGTQQGAHPASLRDHNERAILTLLRQNGALAQSQIATALGLSAQTASVILRKLQAQELVRKCPPIKGKVGKPQTPLTLNATGAYAFGLRLGRRSADLILLDICGTTRAVETIHYAYPTPDILEKFCREAIDRIQSDLSADQIDRIAGLGIGAPIELWNWLDALGAPAEEARKWKDYDFAARFSTFAHFPVLVANDVNLACTGELLFGSGRTLHNFLYFYLGAFIGGAIVLNGQVFHGSAGNAGAFGSIPVGAPQEPNAQLIATASLSTLEKQLAHKLSRLVNTRSEPAIWRREAQLVADWMEQATLSTAKAAVSVVAALDVPTVVLDGVFPADVKNEFAALLEKKIAEFDLQGIRQPRIVTGELGEKAGPLGAAYQPLLAQFFT